MTIYDTNFSTDNISLGPCYVYWNGNHVGHTYGGVSVSITQTAYDLKSDQYGDTPVKSIDGGVSIEVTANLTEATFDNLRMLFASGSYSASPVEHITFGKPVGGEITTGELVLEPTDGSEIFQIYKAAANVGGAIEIGYTTDKQRVFACKFKGMIDNTRVSGDQMFRIGNFSSP